MDNNFSKSGVNIDVPLRNENHEGEKSNKCNQNNYASFQPSNLRTHLKTHSGEKPNKCNQCDFASSHAQSLKTHFKTHSGEKSNKCNQCDYASSQAGDLKTHSGEFHEFFFHRTKCIRLYFFISQIIACTYCKVYLRPVELSSSSSSSMVGFCQ